MSTLRRSFDLDFVPSFSVLSTLRANQVHQWRSCLLQGHFVDLFELGFQQGYLVIPPVQLLK